MAYTEEMTTSEILLRLASMRNELLQAVNDIEKISNNICYKAEQTEPQTSGTPYKIEPSSVCKDEPIDKDINVRSKKDCDNCGTPKHLCKYCIAEDRMWTPKTEPQTCETCKWGEWYRKGYDITMMSDECGGCCSWNNKWKPKTEPQTERVETMSCQECKWWFTDSLKHGGYCQSLLYNHECRYEPEVDCSWK